LFSTPPCAPNLNPRPPHPTPCLLLPPPILISRFADAPTVKHLARLGTSRSHRAATGAALIPGADLVGELLAVAGPSHTRILSLWLAPGTPPPSLPPPLNPPTFTAPPSVLARIAGVESGSGLVAVAEVELPGEPDWWRGGEGGPTPTAAAALPSSSPPAPLPSRLLALDGVQDPGNVGALARAAAALGWDGLILLPGCADPWSAKAVRAARGAAGWRLPTVAVSGGGGGGAAAAAAAVRLRALADRAGLVVLAADASAGAPRPASTASPAIAATARGVCLVLGSEGQGLSPAVAAVCDASVSIPMPGGLESLNVGQAGAILMFALSEGGVREGLMARLHGE